MIFVEYMYNVLCCTSYEHTTTRTTAMHPDTAIQLVRSRMNANAVVQARKIHK